MNYSVKISILLFVVSIITACATSVSTGEAEKTDGGQKNASASRIRLFGQNGVRIVFYRDSTCYEDGLFGIGDKGETVSGGMGQSFSSFIGIASNASIGMPETTNTKNITKRDGTLSKAYFREYEIESEKPLTVLAAAGMPNWGCNRISASFMPKPGKDYEVFLDVSFAEKVCRLQLKEIQVNEGVVELKPIEGVRSALECK